MIKNYDKKLKSLDKILIGRIYYKDESTGIPAIPFPPIKILTHSAGKCTVTMGENTPVQTITEKQALDYIDGRGGYSNTP